MESIHQNSAAHRERYEKRTVVGPTLAIVGKVSGAQDLLVQGRIEGGISLSGCNITVAREGRVQADLEGKRIRVDGVVEGRIQAEEWIHVTGRVRGDLIAPQVFLEKGCRYHGTVTTKSPWIGRPVRA